MIGVPAPAATRPAVAVALPAVELPPVAGQLMEAGFEPVPVADAAELEALLAARRDVVLAVLDADAPLDAFVRLHGLLHAEGRSIPALTIASDAALERVLAAAAAGTEDEYFTRPYSPESLRWRVEAMCIRQRTVDDGSGPVLQSSELEAGAWGPRAEIVTVFNPKGGVGKTTLAANLAAALQIRKGLRVLLLDGDVVSGHVTVSLGLDQLRTLADSWREEEDGGRPETLGDIAAEHSSGMRVVALTASPLETEALDPERVVAAIAAARRGLDIIVVDLHPSYSTLNRAILDLSDRILVPVTPDVPAIRAAVQLRELAVELGVRERLSMVVNRANSGVSVADMERTIAMPALALIRSAGLLFVRATNEGRTVIEMFPKEPISQDFDELADRLLGRPRAAVPSRSPFRFFSRPKEEALQL